MQEGRDQTEHVVGNPVRAPTMLATPAMNAQAANKRGPCVGTHRSTQRQAVQDGSVAEPAGAVPRLANVESSLRPARTQAGRASRRWAGCVQRCAVPPHACMWRRSLAACEPHHPAARPLACAQITRIVGDADHAQGVVAHGSGRSGAVRAVAAVICTPRQRHAHSQPAGKAARSPSRPGCRPAGHVRSGRSMASPTARPPHPSRWCMQGRWAAAPSRPRPPTAPASPAWSSRHRLRRRLGPPNMATPGLHPSLSCGNGRQPAGCTHS